MILFIIVGIPFALFGLYFVADTRNFRKRASISTGKVLGYEKSSSRDSKGRSSTTYAPVVEFTVGHNIYRFEAGISSSSMSYDIGSPIPVYYLPSNPHEAQIKSNLRYVFGGIFLTIGLVISTVGAINIEMGLETLIFGGLILGTLSYKFLKIKAKANENGIYTFADFIAASKGEKPSLDRDLYGTEGKNYQPSENLITEHSAVIKNQTVPVLAIAFIFLLAFGATGAAAYFGKQKYDFLQSASHATGTIIDFKSSTSDGSTTYRPVVRYQHSDSSEVTFTSSWGSSHPSENRGDSIMVLFDPSDKNSAQLDKGIWNWLVPGICALFALMFFYSGAFSIKKRRQHGLS